jgi:hypothetical protein
LAVTDEEGDPLACVILKGPKHGRLFGLGTNYTYSPTPGFVGADRFTYRAWDGTAYSKDGEVTLQISRPPPEPPPRLAIEPIDGAHLKLTLALPAGRDYRLMTSSDLVRWVEFRAAIAATNSMAVVFTNATDPAARFFRVEASSR